MAAKMDIGIFSKSLESYFVSYLGATAVIDGNVRECDPSDVPVYDLTGIIGISGERRGCIFFTAQEDLVKKVLEVLGEEDIDSNLLSDMCGEIANTIAGNVMSSGDVNFELTVPVVIRGRPNSIHLPKNTRAYVIPASWNNMAANLVVCIE